MHYAYVQIGWEIDPGDHLALYRRPKAEQIARLAARMGPWTEEEMRAPITSVRPGFIADKDLARFRELMTRSN